MTPLPDPFLTRPIAHRGLHGPGVPENSRAAARAAIDGGYGIELDLQLSSDGVAMVFHDEELFRLTRTEGRLSARPAAELGRLRLHGGDEGVPALPEFLGLVAGRVPLLIEIKDQHGQMGEGPGDLERATLAALADYSGPVALMSFNPHSVALCARLAPHLPVGLTTSAYDPADWGDLPPETCARLREIPDYESSGASFLSHEARDLGRPRVQALAAAGAALLCWTIRSPEQEAAARAAGAANVTFEGYAA